MSGDQGDLELSAKGAQKSTTRPTPPTRTVSDLNDPTETSMTTQHSNRSNGTLAQQDDPGSVLEGDRTPPTANRMRRSIGGGALALMLVLAACGSSDSDGAKDAGDADKAAEEVIRHQLKRTRPRPWQSETGCRFQSRQSHEKLCWCFDCHKPGNSTHRVLAKLSGAVQIARGSRGIDRCTRA